MDVIKLNIKNNLHSLFIHLCVVVFDLIDNQYYEQLFIIYDCSISMHSVKDKYFVSAKIIVYCFQIKFLEFNSKLHKNIFKKKFSVVNGEGIRH